MSAFGVEGTGSYGTGLARALREAGHRVLEVNRPDRSTRRRNGKDDMLGAEAAARAVLAGQATAEPKSGTNSVAMIRHLKIARDAAVKAKTQAMPAIKSIIVGAPANLREQLEDIRGRVTFMRHLAALRPGPITSTTASAKAALRATARRWLMLHQEISEHDRELDAVVATTAPQLTAARNRQRHRSRPSAARWRRSRAHSVGGRVREALRCLPDPGLQWPDQSPQAEPGR